MNKNIVLTGVGGQGTVLASKLIAAAAMDKDIPVMSAETIGMAQRGGSVFSHLRMGDNILSPMIRKGTADMIIGFEPGETVRMLPYLKEGGQVICANKSIMPVTASLTGSNYNGEDMVAYLKEKVGDNLIVVDIEKALSDIGNPKVMNVLLLGAAVRSGALGLDYEDIEKALKKRLPEKLHEINMKALRYV